MMTLARTQTRRTTDTNDRNSPNSISSQEDEDENENEKGQPHCHSSKPHLADSHTPPCPGSPSGLAKNGKIHSVSTSQTSLTTFGKQEFADGVDGWGGWFGKGGSDWDQNLLVASGKRCRSHLMSSAFCEAQIWDRLAVAVVVVVGRFGFED